MQITARGIMAIGLLAAWSHAGDWPQFMGPGHDGRSAEADLSADWKGKGPAVLWKTPVAEGYGGAAVLDGAVFLMDRDGNAADLLRCLDLDSGRDTWRYAYDAPGKLPHDGSRSTPTVTAAHVYTVGPFGHVHAIDRKTRKPAWSRHLIKDFGGDLPRWGVAASAVLSGDTLLLAPLSETVGVVALDAATGKERWRSPPLGNMGYVTPRLARLCGVDQVIAVSATRRPRDPSAGRPAGGRPKDGPALRNWLKQVDNRIAGISLADGRLLWTYDAWQCMNPIPSPTPIEGDRVFVTGGYHAGSVMLQLARREDGTFEVTERFKTDIGSQIAHPIVHDGHLYLPANGNFQTEGLVCMALDGSVRWRTGKEPALDRGHLLLAGGSLYTLDGRKGLLRRIAPDPKAYRETGRAGIFSGKQLWAPLALSNGRLLVRGETELRCLDLRGAP